ncbi:2-hydroxychromene-2-carboxylate isomerase [Algiphilus sp.]|uniref:2-hydroxychromene-2-carboxylate isomerase n=1 Tax=Algiphilus sp. TaxID=1872431 RepID=UPI003B52E414
MHPIEFFFDPVSPYSYLAATQLDSLAARCGTTVVYKPMLLGAVFKATGNRMPAAVPAKGRYMLTDLQRWAAFHQVPFQFPAVFPTDSKLAQRIACTLPEAERPRWTLAVMRAYWVDGHDIGTEAGVRHALETLSMDAPAAIEAAQGEDAKAALKQLTDEAVSRGVFGAPSFFFGDALFWGFDRLPLLEHHIKHSAAA